MQATANAYLGALNSYLSQKNRLTKNCGHQV
jgi:2-isopropylmalate synthase